MHIYDITLTVSSQLPVWSGDPSIELTRVSKLEEGAIANVTHMNMGVHVGTHVDAPYHFLGGDHMTVEQLPLRTLVGRAYVLRVPDELDLITTEFLEQSSIPPRTRRLIFKTKNSNYWANADPTFHQEFVALSEEAAQYLVDKGMRLVGIDYLSIAPFSDGAPTHRILLAAGVVIVEGLDLSRVPPGRYSLYCLPMKIAGADGAPARAILVGA
jgi:arylformamidase